MANYDAMSSKKLKALLETESVENVELINAVLNKREGVKTQATPTVYEAEPEGELTEAEAKAIEEAEKAFDAKTESTVEPAPTTKVTTKSLEECEALAAILQANVGHKCEVLPFNEIEWVAGVITGVHVEKRANKVLYIIKGVNGKRMLKAHDAKGLKISEEMADLTVTRAARMSTTKKLSTAEFEMAIEDSKQHVGRYVEVVPFNAGDKKMQGLIVGITPDKRVNKVLLRIEVLEAHTNEAGEPVTEVKTIHKVYGSEGVTMLDEWDEERRNAWLTRNSGTAATPEEKIAEIQAKIKKAEEAIEKAKANIDQWNMDLAVIEAVLQKAEAPIEEDLM